MGSNSSDMSSKLTMALPLSAAIAFGNFYDDDLARSGPLFQVCFALLLLSHLPFLSSLACSVAISSGEVETALLRSVFIDLKLYDLLATSSHNLIVRLELRKPLRHNHLISLLLLHV